MNKIQGMVIYETRMQWRRKTWWLIGAGFLLFILFGKLITTPEMPTEIPENYLDYLTQSDRLELAPETFDISNVTRERVTGMIESTPIMFHSLWVGLVWLLLATTLMFAEIIPLDKQYGVAHLLNSLPLNRATYITGKLLSVWINVLILITIGGLIYALFLHFSHGAFDLRLYLVLLVVAMFPAALLSSALGVLLAVICNTRRYALLLGMLLLFPAGIIYVTAIMDLWSVSVIIEPLYRLTAMISRFEFSDAQIVALIVRRFAEWTVIIAGLWLFALSYLRWQDRHV